jgi:hypothetical protein
MNLCADCRRYCDLCGNNIAEAQPNQLAELKRIRQEIAERTAQIEAAKTATPNITLDVKLDGQPFKTMTQTIINEAMDNNPE